MLIKDLATPTEKILSAISEFGSVKASAWTYYGSNQVRLNFEWYAFGVFVPGYVFDFIEWHLGNYGLGQLLQIATTFLISQCGPYTPYCVAAGVIFSLYYWSITSYNKYACQGRGVTIWRSYIGVNSYWQC